jgi:hypothetical protein
MLNDWFVTQRQQLLIPTRLLVANEKRHPAHHTGWRFV